MKLEPCIYRCKKGLKELELKKVNTAAIVKSEGEMLKKKSEELEIRNKRVYFDWVIDTKKLNSMSNIERAMKTQEDKEDKELKIELAKTKATVEREKQGSNPLQLMRNKYLDMVESCDPNTPDFTPDEKKKRRKSKLAN
jgi:hypothetical protein